MCSVAEIGWLERNMKSLKAGVRIINTLASFPALFIYNVN